MSLRFFIERNILGLGAVFLGIVLVIIFTNKLDDKSIILSAGISLAMGVYFLGLSSIFSKDDSLSHQIKELSDKIENDKTKREFSDKERDERLKNIDRIVVQWDREKE